MVKLFRGQDDRKYLVADVDFLADDSLGDDLLFSHSLDGADKFANQVLAKYGMPRPGMGLIWEDAAGALMWCRYGHSEHDSVPPAGLMVLSDIPPALLAGQSFERIEQIKKRYTRARPENVFENLSGDVAEKFLRQWPKERTDANGLPESFHAVYASQWLKLREDILGYKGLDEAYGKTAGAFDLDADYDTPFEAVSDSYLAGVAAGQELGGLLYEWRLCAVHGADVMKLLSERDIQREAQEATAQKRTMWKRKAFELAEGYCAKRSGQSQKVVAEKIRPQLEAYREQVLAGPKVNGKALYYPTVPSLDRLIRAIRDFETDGLLIDGVKKYLTR